MQKIITLIIFIALQCAFSQSATEYNSGAINAFSAGNYAQAKEYFELSLEQNPNALSYYNLANTCEKLDNIGEAKAYYMRAIYLNPRLKEAIFNLNALNKKYNLESYNISQSDKFFDELSRNEWVVLCTIFSWSAILCLIILPLMRIRKSWLLFLGLISLVLSTTSAFAIAYWNSYANSAIAINNNAPLLSSPSPHSEIAYAAKQGQIFHLGKEKAGFYLVKSQNQNAWLNLNNKDFIKIEIDR